MTSVGKVEALVICNVIELFDVREVLRAIRNLEMLLMAMNSHWRVKVVLKLSYSDVILFN